MSALAVTSVDLARIQFATTSIYHFFFVPLTLGLGPIVAVMQTIWHRTRDERWLRLTHFFGTLFLINFAIGVATGLVQEFQFGMNWSVYSKFVGNVFGAPLAIEGLAAFMLEATFLGLWIFGWNRLSPRVHLATLWIAVAGSWLSAYFILVANSWMQHPVGYKIVNGEAQLTSVWDLLTSRWAYWAWGHTIMAGLTAGSAVVFGVCCWHFARGRNQELFRPAAKLALIVLVPIAGFNLWFGSHFGILVTELQPMKISAAEAQWDDCSKCAFSLFQLGGFTEDDQTPSFSIQVPDLLSYLSTGSLDGKVAGLTELNQQYEATFGPGNYIPPVRTIYWSMRVMAYAGSLVALVSLVGAFLLWKRRLERLKWFLWLGVVTAFLPFVAITAGWILTEVGRQPWIVQGLLKTAGAHSPAVSSTMLVFSLAAFVCLYLLLLVLDIWLMRRYAKLDPPELDRDETGETPMPAIGY
ncbi:MAG TPA: cytochrome ubiquinol oxidase subunit I [Gaiellaceae bacterium]|nr:cytochrome ubiquinol oxidase subunit I [Gaiellaceae bacterium]